MELNYDTRVCTEPIELREAPEGGRPTLLGRAIIYNEISTLLYEPQLGLFRERILPGAVTKTLADGHDIRAVLVHDKNRVIGRTSNSTLKLIDGPDCMRCEIIPPNTNEGRDTIEMVREGYATNMSFGMSVPRGGSRMIMENGQRIHEIRELKLTEVSIIMGNPAYSSTNISLREVINEIPAIGTKLSAVRETILRML